MRFAPGWDAALIGWLSKAEAARPGSKPVLSTYPPGFEAFPRSAPLDPCAESSRIRTTL